MDNIVNYLIVLFFIISFLSSVFRKKKKQAEKEGKIKQRPIVEVKTQDVRKVQVAEKKNASSNKNSFENILKAMLQVPEPVEEQKSEVDAYYEEAMRKSEIIKTEKKSLIPASEESHRVRSTVKKSNTYTEAMAEAKKKHSSQKAIKIRGNLHNITKIRDYIVMNEILGKPIALRE